MINQNYVFLPSDHISANNVVVCLSGVTFLKNDAVPSTSGRKQLDIERSKVYTPEAFTKAVAPDFVHNGEFGSVTFPIEVEKKTCISPTLKLRSVADESAIMGSFSSSGITETRKLEGSETMGSPQKIDKCQELEGYLGVKLEEFEIKKEEDECDGYENNSLSPVDFSVTLSGDAGTKPFADPSSNSEPKPKPRKSVPHHVTKYRHIIPKQPYPYVLPPQNASETAIEGHQVGLIEDLEGKYFRCTLCPYKAKSKRYLTQHMLTHKDFSEVMSFQCALCPYKSKRKAHVTNHMLTHKDASEVTTYQCSVCSYKAKQKMILARHMLIHKDASEVATYQCKHCPYRSKRRNDVTKHAVIHQDLSEVTTYQCEVCLHTSKRKSDMSKHVRVHQDIPKVTYDCELCPYKATQKRVLTQHMLVHNVNPKVRVFECELCEYKAKRKGSLTSHMLVHRDASKAETYQCKLCPYKTVRKGDLHVHVLTHKDASEVKTHNCNVCSYKAKLKKHLTRHMLIHKDNSKDAKLARNQQKMMIQHHELEGSVAIKSEKFDIKQEEDDCGDSGDKF